MRVLFKREVFLMMEVDNSWFGFDLNSVSGIEMGVPGGLCSHLENMLLI